MSTGTYAGIAQYGAIADPSAAGPVTPGPTPVAVAGTILTINGVDYDGNARAALGFIGIDSLVLATEGYDALAFSVDGCGPDLPFVPGLPVQFATVDAQGNRTLRFTGDLQRPQASMGANGWTFRYSCSDLKARADNVPVTGLDGSGDAAFNLEPADPMYVAANAGLTVGQIVRLILEVPAVAAGLTEVGVGQIAGGSAGYSIPPATQGDLGALSIVPTRGVHVAGMGVLNQLDSLIRDWHPQYSLYLEADGTIRVRSPFTFPGRPITLPSDTALGDPVDGLNYEIDVKDCFTAYQITGLDIQLYTGSILHKTCYRASDPKDVAVWTINDFLQPKGSTDQGTASNCTSVSVTVHSDDPTAFWTANYLQSVGGTIYLLDTLVPGLATDSQARTITSCTALAPGGTATITWDDSQPLASTSYGRYRIVCTNTPRAEVGRLVGIGDNSNPSNPVDRGTFVGSHLYPKAPRPLAWGNNSVGIDSLGVQYPTAIVQWSADRSGNPPYYELPVSVTLLPDQGRVLLDQPDVLLSAPYQTILDHYPTTEADGAPHDVLLLLPFNNGQLVARVPATGYSGTAFARYGIQRTRVIHVDTFLDRGDLPAMLALANEQLAVYQDAVVTGSIAHLDVAALSAQFDPFAKGWALGLTIPGCATHLDGLTLPVRSVEFSWPNEGPSLCTAKPSFSNQRRPAPNFDRYLHPALANDTFGLKDGGESFGPEHAEAGATERTGFGSPASFGAVENGRGADAFGSLAPFGAPATGGALRTGLEPEGELPEFEPPEPAEVRRSRPSPRRRPAPRPAPPAPVANNDVPDDPYADRRGPRQRLRAGDDGDVKVVADAGPDEAIKLAGGAP